jgi:hypothetical protein
MGCEVMTGTTLAYDGIQGLKLVSIFVKMTSKKVNATLYNEPGTPRMLFTYNFLFACMCSNRGVCYLILHESDSGRGHEILLCSEFTGRRV